MRNWGTGLANSSDSFPMGKERVGGDGVAMGSLAHSKRVRQSSQKRECHSKSKGWQKRVV